MLADTPPRVGRLVQLGGEVVGNSHTAYQQLVAELGLTLVPSYVAEPGELTFVLHDGMGLVAKRLDHIPNSEPPRVRIISDNPLYSPYEGTAEEVNIIGRIRWFAREI